LYLISSLSKGESIGTKLVELFANRVVKRRNMINDYLRGRDCIESVRGVDLSGSIDFERFVLILIVCLSLSFSCSFELLC
jgi:hypothetical protein